MAALPPVSAQRILKKGGRGFTLIELAVVTGIIILITGVVLANSGRYGGIVLLQNLAYDVALSIRQAQVYGISVRRFNGLYAPAYGMHFQKSSPDQYILFADAMNPQNGLYDCPTPGNENSCELVQSTKIQSGFLISDLCKKNGQVETCGLSLLDITFQRPEPDAYIRCEMSPGIPCSPSLNESARIELVSPRGDKKSIIVEINGQIAVK